MYGEQLLMLSENDKLLLGILTRGYAAASLINAKMFDSYDARLFYDEYVTGGLGGLTVQSRKIFAELAQEFFPLCSEDEAMQYVRNVAAKVLARQLGTELLTMASSQVVRYENLQQLLLNAQFELAGSSVGTGYHLADVVKQMQQRPATARKGLPYCNLSSLVPYVSSEYIIIGARTSVGKTAFALDWVRRAKEGAYILSLEMDRYSVAARILAGILRSPLQAVYSMVNDDSVKELAEKQNIIINDSYASINTLPLLFSEAKSRGCGYFVIDYIQMMFGDTPYRDRRDLEIARASAFVRELSRKYEITPIVLAQLNRLVESRQDRKPRLADLRDSGSLEMDADIVFLLSREYREVNVFVAKNRNGATGEAKLYFDPVTMRFEDNPPFEEQPF